MSVKTDREIILELSRRVSELEAQVKLLNQRPNYPPPTYSPPQWPQPPQFDNRPYWLQGPVGIAY